MNLAKQAKQAPNNTANSTSEVQLGTTTGVHMEDQENAQKSVQQPTLILKPGTAPKSRLSLYFQDISPKKNQLASLL